MIQISKEVCERKGNGLANKYIFSSMNSDFVKPRSSHLGWVTIPVFTQSDFQRVLITLSFMPNFYAIVHASARMLCKP